MLPISEGFLGRGLLLLFPVRGANYWLRYATFYLPGKETRFDFTHDARLECPGGDGARARRRGGQGHWAGDAS